MQENIVMTRGGMIKNNPFYREIDDNECALWVLEHKDRVSKKIAKTFKCFGRYRQDHLEDCFDYVIFYFLDRKKDFNENYFLDSISDNLKDMNKSELEKVEDFLKNDTYQIEHYVLSMVKKIALGYYTREIIRDSLLLGDDNLEEDGVRAKGVVSEGWATLNSYCREDNLKIEDDPTLFIEFEEMQDMYDNDLSIYDEDFQSKGLKGFDTKKFVSALFLNGLKDEEEMAKFMGVNIHVFRIYQTGVTSIVTNKNDDESYKDLEDTIRILVDGVVRGWIPR